MALLSSCGLISLLTCNFRIDNVNNPTLAGVNVSSLNDLTKLDAATAIKVTATLLSGSLPLSVMVHIGVSNPNSTAAQIAGLDWILLFNDVQVITGALQQQVYVAPNGGAASIPLTIQTDLAALFKNDSLDKMLQFANGLLHVGEKNAKVTLKIQPTIAVGAQPVKMGYITLNREL
jgi:LEA14-like dessication related protein